MKNILIVVALVLAQIATAQNMEYPDTVAYLGEKQVPKSVLQETLLEREYLLSYIRSPKSMERMIREHARVYVPVHDSVIDSTDSVINLQKLYAREVSPSLEDTQWAKREIARRYQALDTGKYLFIWRDTVTLIGLITKEQWKKPLALYMPLVNNAVLIAVPPDDENNTSDITPPPGVVQFELYFISEGKYRTNAIHEYSHQSTDGNNYLLPTTAHILRDVAVGPVVGHDWERDVRLELNFSYYSNPTEIKARIDVVRYLLYKYGICDLRTEDFTDNLVSLMEQTDEITSNDDFDQLMDIINYNTSVLVWLLNNVD